MNDLRRYLLGEADEAKGEALERAYLSREDVLDSIMAAEHELIEDYLAHRLPPEQKGQFDTHYLASPVHRRRLEISRALSRQAVSRSRRRFALPFAAMAATLLVTLVSMWWIRLSGNGRVATLALPAVIVRSEGETPTVRIDRNIHELRLRLEHGGWQARTSYVAALQTLEGDVVWRGAGVPASDGGSGGPLPPVEVAVPADSIPAGDFFVVLSAEGPPQRELHRYFLRVIRSDAR